MVSDGGFVAAKPERVTVRVTYAVGMICGTTGSNTTASLVPSDSLVYAEATASGLAWRDVNGDYNFLTGITVASSSDPSDCTADSIRAVPGGRIIVLTGASSVQSGRLFYLYETIKYSYEPSVDLPGKIGLYRTDGLGTKEELLAPFDTAASFAFLMGQDMSTVSTVTSGQLQDVRGLELRLIGESYFVPQGEAEPQIFDLRTSVTFRNVVN